MTDTCNDCGRPKGHQVIQLCGKHGLAKDAFWVECAKLTIARLRAELARKEVWRKVSDGLPPEDAKVLAWPLAGQVTVASWFQGHDEPLWEHSGWHIDPPTHWAPLPAAPEVTP